MQRVHFEVRVGVFNCQQILAKVSFVIFHIVLKKIECGLAWHWWNSTDLGLIDMFLINLNIIIRKIAPQAKSGKYFQIWLFPLFGGKNGSVLSMRIQVILDSLFARPGSAPMGARRKKSSGTELSVPWREGEREKERPWERGLCILRISASICSSAVEQSVKL